MQFVKLGDFRFAIDQIICLKEFPTAIRVYLKNGMNMDIPNVTDEDWEIINNMTMQKREEVKPTYLREVDK